MKILHYNDSLEIDFSNIITVGTFDGVHRGHQFIIEALKRFAHELNGFPTIITFEPHPQKILGNSVSKLHLLTTLNEKLALFSQNGVDKVYIIPFTKEFARLTSQEYVKQILLDKIGFRGILIGHDHAFGRNREGGIHTLNDLSKENTFQVRQVDPFKFGSKVLSSSLVRKAIIDGDVSSAREFLGRPYHVSGTVHRGDDRGKELGFPTANIQINSSDKVVPARGVYAVGATVCHQHYKGMANIGIRPTFGGKKERLEVHLFDFSENIYQKDIQVQFEKRIRNEKKFSSVTELTEQLRKDKAQCIYFFRSANQKVVVEGVQNAPN